jgi:hypothetical protein
VVRTRRVGLGVDAAVARLEADGVHAARAEVLSVHARPVAAVIVEAAHRLHADLVALGSHGRGDLAGLLLGSVGHRVAARLDCPVLLVHADGHEARLEPTRRLLVAVDDSQEAMDAVAATAGLAGEHGADVVVVHSLEDEAVDRDGYGAAQHAAFVLLDRAARRTIRAVAASGEVDALIVIFIPPLATSPEEVAAAIGRGTGASAGRLPVLGVFVGGVHLESPVPAFAYAEDAARTLARAARWSEWRTRPEEPTWRAPDARQDEARALVAAALGRGEGWLGPDEVEELLSCYGIQLVESRLASTLAEAGRAANDLGGPVALKAYGPGLLHKSEAGAVALDLDGPEATMAAAAAMAERLRGAGTPPEGFLVQRMAGAGVEMFVGVVQDPRFGPVVACGAGGTAVELLKDVSVRLAPLTGSEADEMIRGLATFPLLDGYRGRPKADVAALRELVLRLGALAEDLPEVAEVDLNPVIVGTGGAAAVDARVRLEARDPRPPEGSRPRPTT